MATAGLDNFLYDLTVADGSANFHFYDPEDADNTADVSVAAKDFPDGATADSRQVADYALAQCSKVLNDKRDARVRKQAAADLEAKHSEDARQRAEAADFNANSQELANTTPTGAQPKESAQVQSSDNKSDDKKSK